MHHCVVPHEKEPALAPIRHASATAVASLLLAAVGGVVLLPADPAAADTILEVTTPADGYYQPGRPTPVEVTVRSDEAVSGVVAVSFEGTTGSSQVVEVPGGSAKVVVLVVDTPPWNSGGTVSFDADGTGADASARLPLKASGGDELVAVLPELAGRELPETAKLTVDLGQARLFPIDPALLDPGFRGLASFNQVLATAADLDALGPDRLGELVRWVTTDGGRLVIDDDAGTPIPTELGSADGENQQVGLGSVAFTGGVAANGELDGLLRPTRSRSTDQFGGWGGVPTTILMAADAGVRIPGIGGLVLALVVYVVAVGPVLWLVLRRGRREPLAWLAIPALAALATIGVYGAGRALRQNASMSHATLVADLPSATLTITQVLASVPGGGSAGVTLPQDWTPSSSTVESPFGGVPMDTSTEQVVHNGELVLDAPVGGVAVVSAERAQDPVEPAWLIDVAFDDNKLTGSVTNNTDYDLHEVIIASGAGVQKARTVEAGETVEVSVLNAGQMLLQQNDQLMQSLFDGDPWSSNEEADNPGLLGNWLQGQSAVRDPGNVLVVGWTREAAGPLTNTSGDRVERGRTARVTVQALGPAAGLDRVEVVRGWEETKVADVALDEACGDVRLTLRITPAAATDGDLVLEIDPKAVAALDLWNGDEWLTAGMADVVDRDELLMPLPSPSLVDGAVYLRVMLSCESWSVATPLPTLRAAGPSDQVAPSPDGDTTGDDDA